VEDYWIQQIVGHKTGRLAGVPTSAVTDQYTFSPQDFESKNYEIKKPILIKSDTMAFQISVALILNQSSVIEI
jgi:hypothetical protein